MKARRNVPVLLILSVTAVVTISAWISHYLFGGFAASVERSQLTLMRQIVDFSIASNAGKALARAEMLAELPTIKRLFAAHDRPGLLAETERMFQVQKDKHGVEQALFHLPPATSFLRLHEPGKFGDDQSKVRPSVVSVNRDKTPQSAFGIGYYGPALFGTASVEDEKGNHIGSFEMGLSVGTVADRIKAAYGLDLAVYIDEPTLEEYAHGVGKDLLSPQNRIGRFIRFHSTNADLMKELVNDSDLGTLDATDYIRTTRDIPYGVVLIPLRNSAGEVQGFMAAAKDFSSSYAADKRTIVWQSLMALFGIVILSGVILVLLRGMIFGPLAAISTRFAALSSGAETTAVPDSEYLCEELSTLVQQYDQMRGAKGAQP
jgi:methyl-accepting chemotaxis protein